MIFSTLDFLFFYSAAQTVRLLNIFIRSTLSYQINSNPLMFLSDYRQKLLIFFIFNKNIDSNVTHHTLVLRDHYLKVPRFKFEKCCMKFHALPYKILLIFFGKNLKCLKHTLVTTSIIAILKYH